MLRGLQIPWKLAERDARITGLALLDPHDGESPLVPVEGVYMVSMIRVPLPNDRSKTETVAFQRSGVGPDQIVEPIGKPQLSIEFV